MRLILLFISLFLFIHPATAQDAAGNFSCDFDEIVTASPLLRQGFSDATMQILNNPVEAQKARQVLSNVQRIFLHPASKSILMYGWSSLPAEMNQSAEKTRLLKQRMNKLKGEAEQGKHSFDYRILRGDPASAQFIIHYRAKNWPQREIGIEIVAGDDCWLTAKLGGNKAASESDDNQIIDQLKDEFSRLRGAINSNAIPDDSTATPRSFMPASFDFKGLPPFNNSNFWAFTFPTLIIALLVGIIIGRAAKCAENKHVSYYFRAMVFFWLGYALILSIFRNSFIDPGYNLSLEHFVYAAIMLVVHVLGLIFGSVMALPSVALVLGHSIRTALFTLMGFTYAPKLIWFDVGLMTIAALYLLLKSFHRHRGLPRPTGSMPNVVDRSN